MIIKKFPIGLYETNCYVLTDEETGCCAIIDPADISISLENYINTNKFDVKYMIFTHGHFDHIGGGFHYSEKYNAEVLIHTDDAICLTDERANFIYPAPYEFVPVKPTTLLQDGDIITIGQTKLNVIHTPGHTIGSISLYFDGNLFSGDTLFYRSIGRTDFPGGSFSALEQSILKLYNLPDNTIVYPGHGDTSVIADEKKSNPFVRLY